MDTEIIHGRIEGTFVDGPAVGQRTRVDIPSDGRFYISTLRGRAASPILEERKLAFVAKRHEEYGYAFTLVEELPVIIRTNTERTAE